MRNVMTNFLTGLRRNVFRLLPLAPLVLLPVLAFAKETPGETAFNVAAGVVAIPIAGVAYIAYTFATFLFWLVAGLFNWVVVEMVFGFATTIGSTEGILVAWGILRDIGNIVLLFGFVFMGLATILNLHDYPVKKTIPKLIIFAVLLNFSLFAAQVIIDASNVFTAALYRGQDNELVCGDGVDRQRCALNYGLTASIMDATGLDGIFDSGINVGDALVAGFTGNGPKLITLFLGLALFVTIATVVFLAAAILLISRAVMLAFLMVTAPIGFIGMAIPPLNGLAKEWWQALIHNAFFAPVFFLLIFVGVKVMEGVRLTFSDNGDSLAAALRSEDVSTMSAIMLFALMIGFMVAALVVAKKFGVMGAEFAVNSASAVVYGTVARGTNFVIGGAAYRLRAMQEKQTARGRGILRGKFGQNLVKYGLTPIVNTNLDLRNVPGVAGVLGSGGIKEGAKISEHAKYEDIQHIYQAAKRGDLDERLQQQYDKRIKFVKAEDEAHKDDGTAANEMSDDSKKFLNELNEEQLVKLHGIETAIGSMAAYLKPEKFEALMKNKDLTEAKKEKLKDARKAFLTGTQNGLKAVREMKPEDVVKLPTSIVTNAAVMNTMSARQFARFDPNDLDPAALTAISSHIRAEILAGSTKGIEFTGLMGADARVRGKWRRYVT